MITRDTADESPSILSLSNGTSIAFHRLEGRDPGIVFLGGYKSDMTGIKARTLHAHAEAIGQAFLRFDYEGHGASSGRFEEATLSDWIGNAETMLDHATTRRVVLVGSSMGAWIAGILAGRHPERVAGLVTIAAAPDFTTEVIEPALTADQRHALETEGAASQPSHSAEDTLIVTRRFLEDSRQHRLLGRPIDYRGPARLIHGMADRDIPWQLSQRLAERLAGQDVRLTLIKRGDHRLSREADCPVWLGAVDDLIGRQPTISSAPPPRGDQQ